MTPKFYLILARCENNGIGYKGRLPWQLRKELGYFGRMTRETTDPNKQNAVVMGRLTWEAMPQNRQPLPGRLNIVLSSQKLDLKGAQHCHNFEEVCKLLESSPYKDSIETVWIIGGSKVYESAINSNFCDRIYLTEIYKTYPCDTFVNLDLSTGFKKIKDPRVPNEIQEEEGVKYEFNVYERAEAA